MLNVQGLTNETNEGISIVSENYDLLRDSTALKWAGNIISINKPSGLSEVQNINFRSWTGEMLPFTKQELPALKCDIKTITKTLTNANIDGEANPWSGSRFIVSNVAASTVTSFTKAWTYDAGEDSQVLYNINECVNMANERMKTIFPILDDAYVWDVGDYKHIDDENIHLSRANFGSGAVGLISKNSNQVQLYNGNTTYPLDVDFLCTSTIPSNANNGVRQCFSNYNNSIIIIDGADMWKPINNQEITRYNIFFNPNTAETASFNETYTWTYGNKPSIVEGRRNGSVFAVITDENGKAYNAVMTSTIYQYSNLVLSGPTLWIADPTAINKYLMITVTKNDWVTFLTSSPLGISTSIYCQVLAFNTIYNNDDSKLYLYCLCATVESEYSQNAYYILWKMDIDLATETHGNIVFIGSQAITANTFKTTLAYHYQYGADVGEFSMETDNSIDYFNFGFKYACKVDSAALDVKILHSCVYDVDSVNQNLVYLCETEDHEGQSLTTILNTGAKDLYDDGGLSGSYTVPGFHAYYLLCDRSGSLVDPYDVKVKGWLRNVSDEHWNWNDVILDAIDQYYLGSSYEEDTAKNIETVSYVDMTLASSTPSASIWNAITRNLTDYASVPANLSDYYNASVSLINGPSITGQSTRPTLILKDSNNVYYQISFILRIYTDPYYFELYTDARDFALPSGLYSLMYGPVDLIYKQVNQHVLNTLEMLITLRYEFNDISLRCLNFPSYDNIVFNIGEITRIDFKKLQTTSSLSRLQFQIVDSSGNIINRDALATLYGSLVLSLDWCY